MVKINKTNVTEYFKGKDRIDIFYGLHKILFSYFCKEFDLPKTAKNYVHFCEALLCYLKLNSEQIKKDNMHEYQEQLLKRCSLKIFSPSLEKVEFSLEKEINGDRVLFNFGYEFIDYLSENFQKYQKTVVNPVDISAKRDTYTFALYSDICTYVEGFKFAEYPFSLMLMIDLFDFCTKHSPLSQLADEIRDEHYNAIYKTFNDDLELEII